MMKNRNSFRGWIWCWCFYALSNETDFEYTSRGWLDTKLGPDPDDAGPLDRPETSYVYDATGNITSVSQLNFLSSVLAYYYDDAGRRIEQMDHGPVVFGHTYYDYDQAGRLVSVTDPLNVETTFTYDASSNVIGIAKADEFDILSADQSFVYDAIERLTQ